MLAELLAKAAVADLDKVEPKPVRAHDPIQLDEYVSLAKEIGLTPPNLKIEEFKAFLNKHDIPVFPLQQVVQYMDKKAAAESKDKCGWEWRPLREKDHRPITFGSQAERRADSRSANATIFITPASDRYCGPVKSSYTEYIYSQQDGALQAAQQQYLAPVQFIAGTTSGSSTMLANNGGGGGVRSLVFYPTEQAQTPIPVQRECTAPSEQKVYDKLVPLHALKKVKLIEECFKDIVAFFVCDYAPAPHIQYPDPFLMAIIDNPNLASGEGRFVIDFWDEPGFGLDKQLGVE